LKIYKVSAPSNIAFLKYWGKEDEKLQWPSNNSLSMTLSECQTFTKAYAREGLEKFSFKKEEGNKQDNSFNLKVIKHLEFLKKKYQFPSFLEVSTHNNFPTASGVASSASGFAALTLAAIAAWTESSSFEELEEKGFSRETLAHLARVGSGSAGRSLFGGYVVWEKGASSEEQRFRSFLPKSHWDLADTIVILSQEEKSLSSREAHKRVPTSPLFSVRLSGLCERQMLFAQALEKKDIKSLGALLEAESLEIHFILMTAMEPFSYLKDNTLEFLSWLRNLRQETHLEVYFTIDAGANVHVICELSEREKFLFYLKRDFPKTSFLLDRVGDGPKLFVTEE